MQVERAGCQNYADNGQAAQKPELETLIAQYEQQQAEIAKLEDFIRRFGVKATKAAQAQERQKMLDKLRENEIVIPENLKKIHFTFPQAPHAGRLILTLKGITKSYDGASPVLNNLDLLVENGDRLVVAGHNGAGKSTLLRIIAGVDSDFSGEVILGAGVSIGYFSQDNAESLKGSQTILELLESEAPLELIPRLRDMLGAFLFRGDDVFKSIDVLSGGEKSRVALLRLLLHPVNLLVLDEPTNHLDMHSKDVLMDALKDFGGTVIFVSHDRGFIEGLSTRVLELKPGAYRTFPGDYEYYMQRLEDEANGIIDGGGGCLPLGSNAPLRSAFSPTPSAGTPRNAPSGSGKQVTPASATKQNWEEQKKLAAERRKIEREVESLEKEIETVENKLKEAQNKLSNPDVYTNGEKAKAVQQEIDALSAQLDELNVRWETAAEKLEA